MKKMSYSLRLQPSLMEELRMASASEGVSLNQLINVAVAEKVSSLRAELYLQERIRRAHHGEALRILDRALEGNPPMADEERPIGELQDFGKKPRAEAQPAPPPNLEPSGETAKPGGWATPLFGKLKKHLERTGGR
jgi:hypothetical protein